jgi:hypothetical protein
MITISENDDDDNNEGMEI